MRLWGVVGGRGGRGARVCRGEIMVGGGVGAGCGDVSQGRRVISEVWGHIGGNLCLRGGGSGWGGWGGSGGGGGGRPIGY